MNGKRVRPMDWILIFLLVLCFTALAFGQKRAHESQQDLEHTNQQLCLLLSAGREASNSQIRTPLRTVITTTATVLEFAAANPNTPKTIRDGYSAGAAELREQARHVKVVQPFPCTFGGER